MEFREYVPLIRRLRPRIWGRVVGQNAVVRSAMNMLSKGTLPQAMLMEGDRGLGKTTVARLIAARLNCDQSVPGNPDPCGECPSCRGIIAGHEGMLVCEVDCGMTNKVEDVRDLIGRSEYGSGKRFRIFIMDEFHLVSQAGKTAVLKSLEEPNSNVKWILCTTEGHKISQMIRSRCACFRFRPLSDVAMRGYIESVIGEEMKAGTVEFTEYESEAIERLVDLSDGSVRQALSHLELVIAYGGPSLTATIVNEVSGRASHSDMSNLVTAVVAGNLTQAERLLRDLYNDSFISDLLGFLYREFLPRQGSLKGDARRNVSKLIRAVVSFTPMYQHSVNRDGILFAMYDALFTNSVPSEGGKLPPSDGPAPINSSGDRLRASDNLVSEFLKIVEQGGRYKLFKEWDGNVCVVGLGDNQVPMAVIRKAKSIPESIKYVLPYKRLRGVVSSKKFDPRALIADGVLLKATDLRKSNKE